MLEALRRGRASGSPLNIGRKRALDVLRVIKAGWQKALACPDVNRDTREVDLNGRLMEGMRAAVDAKVVRSHRKISVLPGTDSWSDNAGAAADGLTDITIHLRDIRERQQSHGPHAVIECKRVAGNDSDLCRLYVTEGVDRFESGEVCRRAWIGVHGGLRCSRERRRSGYRSECVPGQARPWTRGARAFDGARRRMDENEYAHPRRERSTLGVASLSARV